MLDQLFELIDNELGQDGFFMGLAFKVKKGIVIVDKYFDDEIDDGFVIEFVSFDDNENPISFILTDENELKKTLKEIVLQ